MSVLARTDSFETGKQLCSFLINSICIFYSVLRLDNMKKEVGDTVNLAKINQNFKRGTGQNILCIGGIATYQADGIF